MEPGVPGNSPLKLHLILIHFPIALLVTGTVIELFGFLWHHSSVRNAARWMILLGTVAAVPAAASGFCAVVRLHAGPVTDTPVAWTNLRNHNVVTSAGIGLLLLACLIYLGASDSLRRTLHLPLLLMVLVGVGAMIAGAFVPLLVAPPFQTATTQSWSPGAATALQIHLLLASIALPLCVIALGLSFRAAGQPAPPTSVGINPAHSDYAAAFVPHATIDRDFDRPAAEPERVPAVRFWLLAGLFVLAAAGAGIWLLSRLSNTWHAGTLYHTILHFDAHHRPEPTRRLAHVVAAAACILLSLVLTVAARFSPRRGFIAAGFGLLMILSFSAVIWTGTLLAVDSTEGPLTHFNRPPPPPATPHMPVPLETTQPTTAPSRPV